MSAEKPFLSQVSVTSPGSQGLGGNPPTAREPFTAVQQRRIRLTSHVIAPTSPLRALLLSLAKQREPTGPQSTCRTYCRAEYCRNPRIHGSLLNRQEAITTRLGDHASAGSYRWGHLGAVEGHSTTTNVDNHRQLSRRSQR